MKLRALAVFWLLSLSVALGTEIRFPIPGQDWEITIKGPVLNKFNIAEQENGQIKGMANAGRFNVTLFVEPPPAGSVVGTHTACRDFYWTQAKRNPHIVEESILFSMKPNCQVVEYRTQGTFQGTPYVQDHVNCYFVHQGKWVDLHASIITPQPEDTAQLKELAKHLRYQVKQTSSGQPERIECGALGSLSLAVPKGWLKGNVLMLGQGEEQTGFTVSFQSAEDINSNCMLTFFVTRNEFQDEVELKEKLLGSLDALIEASVEKKAEIQSLKLNKGMGAIATFTDAGLVGKPVIPGNAKTITSGIIQPAPKRVCIVSIFADDANGPDASLMKTALETLVLEAAN